MFRYRLGDQRVPAMCLNLAAARLRAELPSGKAPTTRASADLAHDALERIVGPDAAPVFLRDGIVRQGLGHRRLDQLGRLAEPHVAEPGATSRPLQLPESFGFVKCFV
jgi:hypothetical protein